MKKLLTFLTLLTLFFGVGWAETITVDFEGNAIPTGWTASNFTVVSNPISNTSSTNGSYCASTDGNSTDVTLTYNTKLTGVTSISIDAAKTSKNTNGSMNIEFSTDNTNWANAVFETATIARNSWTTTTLTLDQATDGYVRISFSGTTAEKFIDNIVINYGASTPIETVATPTFTPAEGTYTSAQNVTINCETSGATIYYTTNGSTPTTSSSVYSSAIPVGSTTTIKAIAVKSGLNNSEVASATYTINLPTTTTKFERIKNTSDLEIGKRYIIVTETGNKALHSYSSTATTNRSATSVSISNGSVDISSDDPVGIFTLGEGSAGEYTLAYPDETHYLAIGNNSNTLSASTSAADLGITFEGNNCKIAGSSGRIISYYSGGPDFRTYTSWNTGQEVQLYKEVAETTSDKLYLIGHGMNGTEGWNLTTAPQMTFNSSAGTYAIDVYFDKAQRGMFQFAKGLSNSNSNWDGLTGRLYPSTNGSNVSVDTYDMDGTVGLYFTDNSNMYSFELPAGLYTITANLSEWKTYVTQKPVTMTISPNNATFDDTKNVTLASNLTDLGGKIYYTTDGTTPSASNGTEYTGTITLDATTTIKAIAILNYIQSEVVEKTYTKTPAAPVITPNGGTIYAATQVTITAEEGATIYYTTDGSTPTPENGTQYTAPFTVSATTTVKARAYVGDTYSNVTTAEFTYSDVQPSTGDFVLVTSASQLVAGNEYIIMSSYEDDWEDVYNVAFGAISSNSGTSLSEGFTVNGKIGESGSTVSLTDGSSVNVLTLGGSTGAWNLKQSNDYYIVLPKSDTKLSTNASACSLVITIGSDYAANIQNKETTDSRQLRYYITSNYFRNYTTSQGKTENVYLYTRESNSVQPPVFTPAAGIYNVDVDVTISCATTGASIYYTTDGSEPTASTGILYDGNEILVNATTTIKAIAVKGDNSSSVVTAEYTINKSTEIQTVTLDYSEPFTAGIGKFTIDNVSGYSPVWSLDGNYGVKGTAYNANTNPTNNAAVSRLVSPIIDMTDATQPELTFAYQINGYFTNASEQCTLWIRETTNGTSGTWIQLPLSFQTPAEGDWSNEYADISLNVYAGKKVQISFLYNNPEAGTGAGTWEIQNFVVADNSEYKMVNNIAEFLALENGTKAKFRNPVTVLYDYSQYSKNTYQEYIWVKDATGFTQIFLQPSLDGHYGTNENQRAYYENGDVIPAGFVVTKQYYANGGYYQAVSNQATAEDKGGFQEATQKALADPEPFTVAELANLQMTQDNIDTYNNRYVRVSKLKITSKSGKNFYFTNDQNITVTTVGYNKYSDTGSVLKDGTTSAVVNIPAADGTFYNVTAILQKWDDVWEIMPITFTPWEEKTVTLRELCADGVENNQYVISNNLQVVYVKGNSVWVKDDNGQSIYKTSPVAPNNANYEIPEALGNKQPNQAYYDQSNWCELQFTGNLPEGISELPIIKGGTIHGTFSNKMNPTLTGVTLSEGYIYKAISVYNPNYYVARNFIDNNDGYFFMNAKPQEFAQIVWAEYDKETNTMRMTNNSSKNPEGFKGSFKVNMELNSDPNIVLQDWDDTGMGYEKFEAIIRLKTTQNQTAPMLKGTPEGTEYEVFPLNITNTVTAIDGITAGKAVKSVKYVNVAGIMSDTPFEGVNIVVTEYTDGSRSTTKMLRK